MSTYNTPSAPVAAHETPEELKALRRWSSYRTWTCKKGYVRHAPVHPSSKKKRVPVGDPSAWLSFDAVATTGKPVGFLVREEDGLAAFLDPTPDLAVRFASRVVWTCPSGHLIVRADTPGSTTNRFVPVTGGCNEVRTGDGTNEDRTGCNVGCNEECNQARTENQGVFADGCNVGAPCLPIFLKDISDEGSQGETVDHQLTELATRIFQQGKDKGTVWAYALVNLLRAHGYSPDDMPTTLLLEFDSKLGLRPGQSHTLALSSWDGWRSSRVGLVEAYRAVRTTGGTSLLEKYKSISKDAAVVVTATIAGWLGQEGEQFAISSKELADTIGLRDHREASDVLRALRKAKVIDLVKEASFKDGESNEYKLVGVPQARRSSPPLPPPTVPAAPPSPPPGAEPAAPAPPKVRQVAPYRRVSDEQTEHYRIPSKFGGGWVTYAEYLVEMVAGPWSVSARSKKLEWTEAAFRTDLTKDEEVESWLAIQRKRAKYLLDKYGFQTVCKVLRENKRIYSLAPAFVEDACKAKQNLGAAA